MPVIDKVSRNPMNPAPSVTMEFMVFPDYRTGTAIYTGIRGVIKKISVSFWEYFLVKNGHTGRMRHHYPPPFIPGFSMMAWIPAYRMRWREIYAGEWCQSSLICKRDCAVIPFFIDSLGEKRENLNRYIVFLSITERNHVIGVILVKRAHPPSTIKPILEDLRDMMTSLKERYQVASLSLFGSWIRGEQTDESDLDILVEFTEPPGLISFLILEEELSNRLGLPVDLVMKGSLKPAIGTRILREAVPV